MGNALTTENLWESVPLGRVAKENLTFQRSAIENMNGKIMVGVLEFS